MSDARGWLALLRYFDCMHWRCKNCPKALEGQYQGHFKKPTIILDTVVLHDLWIWHAFFGMLGSHSDINMLRRSPSFAKLTEGQAPPSNYTSNGHHYNMGHYLYTISILCGLHQSRLSLSQLVKKEITLPKDKNELKRMWRGLLECSNPILQLLMNLLNYGIQRPCGK